MQCWHTIDIQTLSIECQCIMWCTCSWDCCTSCNKLRILWNNSKTYKTSNCTCTACGTDTPWTSKQCLQSISASCGAHPVGIVVLFKINNESFISYTKKYTSLSITCTTCSTCLYDYYNLQPQQFLNLLYSFVPPSFFFFENCFNNIAAIMVIEADTMQVHLCLLKMSNLRPLL